MLKYFLIDTRKFAFAKKRLDNANFSTFRKKNDSIWKISLVWWWNTWIQKGRKLIFYLRF